MNTEYDLAIESFIEYLDGMEIAGEGFTNIKKGQIQKIIHDINSTSEKAFRLFKEQMLQKKTGKSGYDEIRKKRIEEFYKTNVSYPKVSDIDTSSNQNSVTFYLNTKGDPDYVLFYQDVVCKLLNDNITKIKGIGFYTEDYPGIHLRLRL